MTERIIIDGIYFSKHYIDSWIVKYKDQYYAIPSQVLQSKQMQPISLSSEDTIRPVGQNVEKLLLAKSDMISKNVNYKSILIKEENINSQNYQREL